jgi:hypothetical protein
MNKTVVRYSLLIVLLCVLSSIVIIGKGCRWSAPVKVMPSHTRLLGRWAIAPEQTTSSTWRDYVMARGGTQVELKPDGRFGVKNLVIYPPWGALASVFPASSGAGRWQTQQQRYDERCFVLLCFDEINGTPIKDSDAMASLWLWSEGEEVTLRANVDDPDSGKFLVLTKDSGDGNW